MKSIVARHTYTKDGQEQTSWKEIGVLIEKDNGKAYVSLNMFPDQLFYVFDNSNREKEQPANQGGYDISMDDIPL